MQIMLGNEAVARGAYEAGVRVISSYPGTPSTEITESFDAYEGLHAEWAPNEKVALETAIGASLGGIRALSAMKHVGLNVAADPLFTASYIGVRGGLVVVVADDPGMHSSQNEQDSRHYARAAKLPMLEPADSEECRAMTRLAFDLSERFDCPVLVRLTTRVAHTRSPVYPGEPAAPVPIPYAKDAAKYVMMPAMARMRHRVVEERMQALAAWTDSSECPVHLERPGMSRLGIVTSGAACRLVEEALPGASILKLGLVWPLPVERIRAFAARVDRLVVVEELDPFLETEILARGIPCEGKSLFSLLGEYTASMIRSRLAGEPEPRPGFAPDRLPAAPARPPVLCAGCPHRPVFLVLSKLKAVVSGDIGCYTLGALSPYSAMDTCVCMGASVGVAHGMAKASGFHETGSPDAGLARRTVAVIGDSTFLHSGVTGLMNAVYNGSGITLLILDNSITGMTGHQQNPSTGLDLRKRPAPSVDLEAICRACGVQWVRTVDPVDMKALEAIFREEMARDEVSVVIVRSPCALIPAGKHADAPRFMVLSDRCRACGACIRLSCPAIDRDPAGKSRIDSVSCSSCGLCFGVCRFDAIVPMDGKGER